MGRTSNNESARCEIISLSAICEDMQLQIAGHAPMIQESWPRQASHLVLQTAPMILTTEMETTEAHNPMHSAQQRANCMALGLFPGPPIITS